MVITDNFGIVFARIMRPPQNSNASPKAVLKDSGGVDRTFDVWSGGANFFQELSTFVQVGDGDTSPTPQDVDIENPFSNAPENDLVLSELWGITAEETQAETLIANVGENGSVKEVGLFRTCRDTSNTLRDILLARDVISAVPFIIGDNIITENKFTL